jgi:antitoxin component YwqK of YwqJK toxin-antitoxin module
MNLKTTTLLFGIILLGSSCNKFDGKDGIKTVYFPESEIVQQIVEYKDGKRIGELKEFYRNGNLKVRQYYKNDSLTDSAFFYYENGNLQYTQYLKDFKKEGTWKKYNEQGKVYEEINFKDDYLDGYTTTYTYRTGRVLQRLHYTD